jgi:hypothetical protein
MAPLNEIYIDSQTLGEVIRALDTSRPTDWTYWNAQAIVMATSQLISVRDILISPSARLNQSELGPFPGASGSYGTLARMFSSTVKTYTPSMSSVTSAGMSTRRWAERNTEKLKLVLQQVEGDQSYETWIDHESTKGWETAFRVINGVVDKDFLSPISKVIDVSNSASLRILERSQNPSILSDWCDPRYTGEDKEIAKRMFTIGALIRGRYHDRVAELDERSIIHHPLRAHVLKRIAQSSSVKICETNTVKMLSRILIGSALLEKNQEARVIRWCSNVCSVRDALHFHKDESLPIEDLSDRGAEQRAFEIARRAGVSTTSTHLDSALRLSVSLSSAVGAAFIASPWLSVPVGFVADKLSEIAMKKYGPSVFSRPRYRLRQLVNQVPARLVYGRQKLDI